MQNLFVYGSLQFPEITKALTGKSFKAIEIILAGHKRYSVFDADYPAVVEDKSSEVSGKILFDVDDKSVQIITFFEGNEYKIVKSDVTVQHKKIPVLLFIWNGDEAALEDKVWDKTKFTDESLLFYTRYVIPETVNAFYKIHPKLKL